MVCVCMCTALPICSPIYVIQDYDFSDLTLSFKASCRRGHLSSHRSVVEERDKQRQNHQHSNRYLQYLWTLLLSYQEGSHIVLKGILHCVLYSPTLVFKNVNSRYSYTICVVFKITKGTIKVQSWFILCKSYFLKERLKAPPKLLFYIIRTKLDSETEKYQLVPT